VTRPNVIVITCHDLGDMLGCYGVPVATPKLDALAASGALLVNHFSTDPVCSPARGSIVTGCYPHTNGLMGLVHRGWSLDVDKCPALPMVLGRAGYETILFGLEHEHPVPSRMGYQSVHPVHWKHSEEVCAGVADWLRHRRSGRPFFAGVGFAEVHRLGGNPSNFMRDVYQPEKPEVVAVPPYLPDIPEIREDLAWFYGAIKHMDKSIGQVMEALDRTGLRKDTIVVFLSDHGPSFQHAKATLYDGGIKVAGMMSWPGGIPAGLRCRALTSHVDVLPTLLDLLGLAVPKHMEGMSQLQLVRGGPATPRKHVFAEKNVTNYFDPTRAVRNERFKYIRKGVQSCIFDFVIPEIEGCKANFRANRAVQDFYSARRCREEFYDLSADPGELNNRIDDPACAGPLCELRSALDAHLVATDDPFRNLRIDILLQADGYEKIYEARKNPEFKA